MSYDPAGLAPFVATGATAARDAADRAGDYLTVRDFGAKGDGTTDDTNALYSAFTSGKAVVFPAGTYLWSGSAFTECSADLIFRPGAVLKMTNTSGTLHMYGSITAGRYQIFNLINPAGNITFFGESKAGQGRLGLVYPEWWGAIGDAITDCTAALKAICSNGCRGVDLGSGAFLITDTLTITGTGFTLRGAGRGSCSLSLNDSSGVKDWIKISGQGQVLIAEITFLRSQTATGGGCVHVVNGYDVRIQGVSFPSQAYHGVLLDGTGTVNTNKIYLFDSYATGLQGDAFHSDASGVTSGAIADFELSRCYIRDCLGCAVYMAGLTGGYITDNVIYHNKYGIYYTAAGTAGASFKVRGNDIDSNTSGNYVSGSGEFVWSDNWMGAGGLSMPGGVGYVQMVGCNNGLIDGNLWNAPQGQVCLQIDGGYGLTISGNAWNQTNKPILINPGTSAGASKISIIGGTYDDGGASPVLVTFGTGAYTADSVLIAAEVPSGYTAVSGSCTNLLNLALRPSLTYSRSGSGETAACAAIRTALANIGLVIDSTTA